MAARHPQSRGQRAVRRGRRRHVLGRQALQPDQGPAVPWPQGADRVRRRRRAGGHPVAGQAAYRHVPPRHDGREHARQDRGARRQLPVRYPPRAARARARRRRPAARRRIDLEHRRDDRRLPRRARRRPQRARYLRDAARAPASRWKPSRSRSASASSIRSRSSTARASDHRPGTSCSAPPTTSSSTTARTAAASTRSACAPAARLSRRPPRPAASSPTA